MDKTVIQVFETSAREYDAWFEKHRLCYESELRALKTFAGPHYRGLELGVGTGRFAAPLGIAVGVEPALAMAAIARERGIQVVGAVAEALPFRDDSFDLVAMVTVLCFLQDPFLSLTEATRVLKPGGQIIIGMIDKDSILGRSYEVHKSESKFYRQAHFYTVNQVLDWLATLPFGGVKICQTLFKDLGNITSLQPVQDGHGAGGFVVIAAHRK